MSPRPLLPCDSESVVNRLRTLAQSRGEAITLGEFARHMGVDRGTLVRHCGPWSELRAAAGLKLPCAPRPPTVSDQSLIDEYRRIVEHFGRPPRKLEFDRLATVRYCTLIGRFGSAAEVHRRARACDEFEQAFGPDFPFHRKPDLPWDEAWLRELWPRLRVAFALHSSDLRAAFDPASQTGDPTPLPDVIFCALHDWRTAPVPVLVASEVLGERAGQPPVSQHSRSP